MLLVMFALSRREQCRLSSRPLLLPWTRKDYTSQEEKKSPTIHQQSSQSRCLQPRLVELSGRGIWASLLAAGGCLKCLLFRELGCLFPRVYLRGA